jgi:excisionase family DNA binding protein
MTPKELADFLQISPATLRRQMREGAIPFFHVGGQIRFLPRVVVRTLIRRKSKTS